MSFIQKSDAVVINSKLTNTGRLLLASGSLTFKKIEFGDSEMDYNFLRDNSAIIEGTDFVMMRPKDANPNIKYPLPISDTVIDTKTNILQISPSKRLITNTAKQRGFFTGSTSAGFTALTSSTYILGVTTVNTASVSGTNTFTVASATNITVGKMLLVDWRNPKLTTFTALTGVIGEAYPRPFLWYKVISVVGTTIEVDRPLPNFSGSGGTIKSLVYIYPPNNAVDNYYSTGTTVSYWNYNTLAFDSTCNIGSNDDVSVWNFTIAYNQTPAGVTNDYYAQYYDNAVFTGFKQYIQGDSTNSIRQQLGIIHYTNNSISNYYGEGFLNNTFRLTLPTIMYHKKTTKTMGIVLSASTIKRNNPTNLTGFTTEFYDLVESTSQNIVGKVFNDLKIAVIEDEELVNVLALKSDRSHTLPLPKWQLVNATTEESSANNLLLPKYTSLLPPQYLALTYILTTENYNTNKSFGFRGGIHCGYIRYFDQNSTTDRNILFSFEQSDLTFMENSLTSSNGTGFNANKLYILAQIVPYGEQPTPADWILMDYTSKLAGYSSWNGNYNMPISALTSQNYRITKTEYDAGIPYDIENFIGPLPTAPSYTTGLGFGEESILLGNVNTSIKANVYKTQIIQNLGFSQYNTSNNPTFENGDDVFVTEAGVYDDNNNLVAVAKLNNPIKKNNTKLFTIEIDMDF
jgi:hypothetical protein